MRALGVLLHASETTKSVKHDVQFYARFYASSIEFAQNCHFPYYKWKHLICIEEFTLLVTEGIMAVLPACYTRCSIT